MIALVFISQVDFNPEYYFSFWILRLSTSLSSFRDKTHTTQKHLPIELKMYCYYYYLVHP
jgi:hypothetical protein